MTLPDPPLPEVEPRRRSVWRNLSVIWLVPFLALAVALGIAWQAFSERGALIVISFENAGGVAAGETTLRYREVVIGTVEEVSFSPDLQNVLVEARVDQDILPFLDQEASFWVVQPEVSARGITGLSTVVSGVYIEGAWDSDPGVPTRGFIGREDPPLVLPGEVGRRLTLRADSGSVLSEGAPIFYRGIEVGRLERPELTPDGSAVLVDAFISEPHDARLNQGTRFWDSSGFSVSVGPQGLSLDVRSLASLVAGGIEFDNVFEGGEPFEEDYVFQVYETEDAARDSAFVTSSLQSVPVSVEFSGSVRGLTVGAAVEMAGLAVGEVTAVNARVVETSTGPKVRLVIDLAIDPGRMGLPSGAGAEELYGFLADAVEGGMRARLSSASLLSSSLKVELVTLANPPRGVFDLTADPYPVMPSLPTDLPDLNATAEGILDRIVALPLEDLMNQAIDTLASIEGLADDPSLREVPGEAAALLAETRGLIGGDATQAVPGQALAAVAELRILLAQLRGSGLVSGLNSAVGNADLALERIAVASEDLPAITANLRELSETATELEINALIASANTVLDGASEILNAEATQAIPQELNQTLSQLRALVTELEEGGVAENLNAALSGARTAADAASAAATELPALVEQTQAVLTQASALVATYGTRSDFMGETMDVLRELQNAARSIAQLARTIERNPSSLITGR